MKTPAKIFALCIASVLVLWLLLTVLGRGQDIHGTLLMQRPPASSEAPAQWHPTNADCWAAWLSESIVTNASGLVTQWVNLSPTNALHLTNKTIGTAPSVRCGELAGKDVVLFVSSNRLQHDNPNWFTNSVVGCVLIQTNAAMNYIMSGSGTKRTELRFESGRIYGLTTITNKWICLTVACIGDRKVIWTNNVKGINAASSASPYSSFYAGNHYELGFPLNSVMSDLCIWSHDNIVDAQTNLTGFITNWWPYVTNKYGATNFL